jgi:hypothetical protein
VKYQKIDDEIAASIEPVIATKMRDAKLTVASADSNSCTNVHNKLVIPRSNASQI